MRDLHLSPEQEQRAANLHRRAIVYDMGGATNPAYPTLPIDDKFALDRGLCGGLTVSTVTVAAFNQSFREAIKEMNLIYRLLQTEPDKTLLVQTAADIQRAKDEGKVGICMGFQTASPVEDDWTNTLPALYRLGLRVMQLTYNERNLLGSGCAEPRDEGLTAYGRQVVGAMNSLGILVDLSHVGRQTALDAMKLSQAPVIFSHANVAALTPHYRNLDDEMIKALADKGGVMGIVAWTVLCQPKSGEPPTLSDYLDQIDYVVNLVGVDHVGLGSDINENFRAMPIPSAFEIQYKAMLTEPAKRAPSVEGFEWLDDFPNVTRGLVARGYSDDDILNILGGNFTRVAARVWDRA